MKPERWQQITDLYHAAIARDPAERVPFLDQACGGDADLRQRVERLVEAHEQAGDFIGSPAFETAPELLVAEDPTPRPTLVSGARLGPYEIVALVGTGGMGEVYRARDTRLDRTVAVKVLPSHLSTDPDRRQRFEREARAVSSLNHPHICALYDVGHQDGIDYLVMEYVEGETLAERLQRRLLPLDLGLRYAAEIADALDKAHREGVTHRDLKPGNVMLTKSGTKLLDFGLAKLKTTPDRTPISRLSPPPTDARPLTGEGMLLGTFQYMAPEQLEGKDADARSDIWALGCVIYEMATGPRASPRKGQPDLISAILKDDPAAIASVRPLTPAALDRLVKKCLARDPDERWQSAHDLVSELGWIAEGLSQRAAGAPTPADRRRERALWALAVVILTTAAAVVGRGFGTREATPVRTSRRALMGVDSEVPVGAPGFSKSIAISRDGRQVAYVAFAKGFTYGLRLQSFGGYESTPLAGTDRGVDPFFSPDGRWVGFFASGKLKKVAVTGGSVVTLAEAPEPHGGVWGADDMILYAPSGTGGLWRIPASGGEPKELTRPDASRGEVAHGMPSLLPDGRYALFASRPKDGSWNDGRILMLDLATGGIRVLLDVGKGGHTPIFVRTGHLVFARAEGSPAAGTGSILAIAFDPEIGRVEGSPTTVLDHVVGNVLGWVQAVVSDEGTLLYAASDAQTPRRLVWVDRNGHGHPALDAAQSYEHPRLSADGTRALVGIRDAGADVWLADLTRGTLTRLTFDPGEEESAVWMPDGRSFGFAATRAASDRVTLRKPADGSGAEELLLKHDGHHHLGALSPDGRFLAYSEISHVAGRRIGWDVWIASLGSKPDARQLLATAATEQAPSFSPDGHFIAYSSDESGRPEVYVQVFPGPGRKWQVSAGGGTEPLWAPGGREIFYRSGDKMMAVAVRSQPHFSLGTPRILFEGRYGRNPWGERDYDVSRDGSRFLMVSVAERQGVEPLHVVFDWFEELKQKVPLRR